MSRFDSENLNAPHTQRHLDEIPQRTAPSVDQMAAAALARNTITDRMREHLLRNLQSERDHLAFCHERIERYQDDARRTAKGIMEIRRELGE